VTVSALISSVMMLAMTAGFSTAAVHPRRTTRPTSCSRSLDVRPAAAIEARVAYEVARAREILDHLNQDNLLASPYLVSAIYYHDGFLKGFPVDRPSADPERRIVGQICNLLTPEGKARFVSLLHEIWLQAGVPGPPLLQDPLNYSTFGGSGASHPDAIDLFAAEGSPVHSVSRGIVVMADGDWIPGDPFSTSSRKGGNAVIIFNPDHDRFYRYCHLSTVLAVAGGLAQVRHGTTGNNDF
jgi:murein DD-endopeptidase MepM/ murein hydrolase activator NlpD